jgi:hypothetical protein
MPSSWHLLDFTFQLIVYRYILYCIVIVSSTCVPYRITQAELCGNQSCYSNSNIEENRLLLFRESVTWCALSATVLPVSGCDRLTTERTKLDILAPTSAQIRRPHQNVKSSSVVSLFTAYVTCLVSTPHSRP